jgi:hypothetical protein
MKHTMKASQVSKVSRQIRVIHVSRPSMRPLKREDSRIPSVSIHSKEKSIDFNFSQLTAG